MTDPSFVYTFLTEFGYVANSEIDYQTVYAPCWCCGKVRTIFLKSAFIFEGKVVVTGECLVCDATVTVQRLKV